GKSTLMKILAGNYPSGTYEGEILIKGKRLDARNALDSEKAGIAMIYQELNVELDLSVGENVLLGRWPKK
ncbi:ATP-binding cassette domain-containing protein, partial [[Clostridium] symbiosum]